MITLENINKNFGSKVALKNISCSFEAGKVYGIVGENGAGKTTLFRCIAGLETFRGELKSPYQPLKNELGGPVCGDLLHRHEKEASSDGGLSSKK